MPSGSFSGNIGTPSGRFALLVEYNYSQSVSGNYSILNMYGYVRRNTTSVYPYNRNGGDATMSITGASNGSSWTTHPAYDLRSTTAWVKVAQVTGIRLNHNADGTKSTTIGFSFDGNLSNYYPYGSISKTISLATIPRASSLSAPTINFGETGTFTISRASSGFTHTITAKFGTSNYSATIATKTSATSVKWTLPLEWANGIPNSQTGTMTYTIYTYSGSTHIGTKTTTGKVVVLQGDAFPMIEGIDVLDANTDIVSKFGEFVQSKSIAKADGSYHTQYGATIKNTFIEVEGKRYTSTTNISQATVPISGSGKISVKCGVVDSRGFENSQTKEIQVTPYSAPTMTEFSAFRCDASGVAEDEGTRLNCKRTFNISPISNKNANTWKIEARKSGDTSWSPIANGTGYAVDDNYITSDFFDVDYPYEVQFTIADTFATISKIIEISTAFTIVDYHNTGEGIAFGKVATEQGLFDVDFPTLFRQGTKEILPVHRSANFDEFMETGKYYITSNVGGVTTKAGWLEVFAHPYDSNYCQQRFTTYSGERFERIKNAGVWEQWCGTFMKGIWTYTTQTNGLFEAWGTRELGAYSCYATSVISGLYLYVHTEQLPIQLYTTGTYIRQAQVNNGETIFSTGGLNDSPKQVGAHWAAAVSSGSCSIRYHVKGYWKKPTIPMAT